MRDDVRRACETVAREIRATAQYAHTSRLLVWVDGAEVYDAYFGGARRGDIFSVTKSVLATLVGCAVLQGRVPPLDDPVSDVLPVIRGTPSAAHTWRHLLTMTRGCATDGPWEVDEVTALPGGQVQRVAAAPQVQAPGIAFRYDNGAAHLLSAALGAVVGTPVAAYAQGALFEPLGIERPDWLADPDGVSFGFGHLRLSADELCRLGTLWLAGGVADGVRLIDADFLTAMTSRQTAGGPPEGLAYGFLVWIDDDLILAGGWAGQHVAVVPSSRAVLVVTGDPQFDFGPPPSDQLGADWRPALDLVRRYVLPLLHAT